MKVFIDTGAFLALADNSDFSHDITTSVYQKILKQKAIVYTSNYVIDEVITLIRSRVGHDAAVAFIKGFEISKIPVLRITEIDENLAINIFIKYRDKKFSFTDCTSFALIDRYAINAVMSLDEHFSQYSHKHTVMHLLLKSKQG